MQFKPHAIILAVVEALHQRHSWTGKTHVQKTISLLNDKGKMAIPFRFVLYRHGPYSFDLEAELEQMKSYGALDIDLNTQGYGVILRPGSNAGFVREKGKLSLEEMKAIDDVCDFVKDSNIWILERLATASWIRVQEGITERESVARRLNSLKPHISIEEAKEADAQVEAWLAR